MPRVDQPAKLRELLTGHPLALVPESIKTIEKAFSALGDWYGDEERVLGLRVAELKKLGTVPEKYLILSRGWIMQGMELSQILKEGD